MKKIYQTPQIQVVRINTGCSILAGSPGAKSEGYNPSSENLAPAFYFDDDDD